MRTKKESTIESELLKQQLDSYKRDFSEYVSRMQMMEENKEREINATNKRTMMMCLTLIIIAATISGAITNATISFFVAIASSSTLFLQMIFIN